MGNFSLKLWLPLKSTALQKLFSSNSKHNLDVGFVQLSLTVCLWIQQKQAALSQNLSRKQQLSPLPFCSHIVNCLMQTLKRNYWWQEKYWGGKAYTWNRNWKCTADCTSVCARNISNIRVETLSGEELAMPEEMFRNHTSGGLWGISVRWKIDYKSETTRTFSSFTYAEFYKST